MVGLCRPGTSKMVFVFELRILRPVKECTAGKLLRGFEPMVKGMRGLGQWAMVAWSSHRSEVVLQVVAESGQVAGFMRKQLTLRPAPLLQSPP